MATTPAAETPPETPPEGLLEKEPTGERVATRYPELLEATEMLSLMKKFAVEIADALVDGEKHREQAVRLRDAIKLSCIQDRLSNMKLMKKLSDNRLASAERPLVRADELSLRHEFRGAEMARERVLQLQRELIECVGSSLEISENRGGHEAKAGAGGIDPGGTSVVVPPADRPQSASTYK